MQHAVSDIIDQLSQIPPFPKVTTHLLKLLNDPSVSVQELAEVISADPSLVVKVLHLANSPFYMLSRPVQSVSEAVFVLGVSAIKTITTAISVQQGLASLKPRPDVFDIMDFWKHSYATAIAANKLAKEASSEDGEKLYLVGLIHDIGKIVQANHWPETWKAAVTRLEHEGGEYEDIEMELFSQSHAEIATVLCRNWQFPNDVLVILEAAAARGDDEFRSESIQLLEEANRLATISNHAFPKQEADEPTQQEAEQYGERLADLRTDVEYQLQILEL